MIGINIIKIYINLCVKGQFATFCRCIVTVSFLIYLCILTSHTRFSYKVMLVSSGARSIALFSIYIFSTIALFCAFSVGNYKTDMKSHQWWCYFKWGKKVIRKVPITNGIFYFYFILICVLNVNFFAVSLPLVFLFICVYWRHTQFSYKVMLVSSGTRSIRIFRIYPLF
jgi:hypothetical protein